MIAYALACIAAALAGWWRPRDYRRLRRRWTLWRRRATRRDRRWQHYGARCWYGHRLLLRRALIDASLARVENHQRILDAFAAARNAEARAMAMGWGR